MSSFSWAKYCILDHINRLEEKKNLWSLQKMLRKHLKCNPCLWLKKEKALSTLEIRGYFLKRIKTILQNPTANIYNGETLNLFPLRWVTRQVCPLTPLFFSTELEILHSKRRKKQHTPRNKDLEGRDKTALNLLSHIFHSLVLLLFPGGPQTKAVPSSVWQPRCSSLSGLHSSHLWNEGLGPVTLKALCSSILPRSSESISFVSQPKHLNFP